MHVNNRKDIEITQCGNATFEDLACLFIYYVYSSIFLFNALKQMVAMYFPHLAHTLGTARD